jgi:hypothetical protein
MNYYEQTIDGMLVLGTTSSDMPDGAKKLSEAAYNTKIERERIVAEQNEKDRVEDLQREMDERKNKVAELVDKMIKREPLTEEEQELLIERLS